MFFSVLLFNVVVYALVLLIILVLVLVFVIVLHHFRDFGGGLRFDVVASAVVAIVVFRFCCFLLWSLSLFDNCILDTVLLA